ncbi:MAG: hypothetical protein ACON31_10945 [Candidatus Puniceispirillaceae bacterium]
MKNSRNRLYHQITAMLAGLAMGLTALGTVPGIAQEVERAGPVDLLATISDGNAADNRSGDAPGARAPIISSIDDAIEAIADNADRGDSDAAAAPAPSAPLTQGVSETVAEAAPEAEAVPGDDGATASVSLTRGPVITSFGVADIGVDPQFAVEAAVDAAVDEGLTTTIWRGTPVDRATILLDSASVVGASPSLSALAHRVVAHRAVPPAGAADAAESLVNARLSWLASAGRSRVLENLVGQLPNDPPWLDWKQWHVETQLMSRRDDEACRTVMYQVSRTFEPFWHKAKVICSAARGDAAGAQFAADILQAMGVDDAAFSALVDTLLSGGAPEDLDPALLEPLHIVLMDAAHVDIDTDGLAALSDGSVQTAVGLRYLNPEARLVSTWRALARGLIDHDKAAKLWRSVKITPDAADLALARHRSQPSALTRALAWRALDAEKSPRRLAFAAAMMDADIASGAGLIMAPLYAELVREAAGFDGAADMLAADRQLAGKLGMLMTIGEAGDLPEALATSQARAARALLDAAAGTAENDLAALGKLEMWHLLPLVEARAKTSPDRPSRDWIGLAMPTRIEPASYLSVSPLMLLALEQAASSGRVAEAVLMAHRIVGTLDLAALHPADVSRIAAALSAAGQKTAASTLAAEVAASHLMAAMQAVEITLPERSDLMGAGADTAAMDTSPQAGADVDAGEADEAGETGDTGEAGDTGETGEPSEEPAPAADDGAAGSSAAQQDANDDS